MTHTNEKPIACPKCDFRTNRKGALNRHMIQKHDETGSYRTHTCDQCGKGFITASDLKEHIYTHTDIKRFTCPTCGQKLKNDSCYRRHMMCVHGEKVTCEVCGKDYSSPVGLKVHQRNVHNMQL